jgi:hypothetical protein
MLWQDAPASRLEPPAEVQLAKDQSDQPAKDQPAKDQPAKDQPAKDRPDDGEPGAVEAKPPVDPGRSPSDLIPSEYQYSQRPEPQGVKEAASESAAAGKKTTTTPPVAAVRSSPAAASAAVYPTVVVYATTQCSFGQRCCKPRRRCLFRGHR